jgi:hypothetical protein
MRPVSLGGSVARCPAAGPPSGRSATPPRRLGEGRASALGRGLFVAARLHRAGARLSRETYYDEALTGLMSLAIPPGVPQVFYWGQPYLGAVDAYLAAGASRLRPLDLAPGLGVTWISLLWVWAAWRIGRKLAGERWGSSPGSR